MPESGATAEGLALAKPLRIAFFLYEFPVVSETFVLNQITGLLDLGHDVTIWAERSGPGAVEHPDFRRYGLAERTHYLDMPERKLARLAGVPLRLLRSERRGALLRAMNLVRYGAEARSLRLFYWAAELAGEDAFDIIHCHFGPRGRVAAFLREIGAMRGKLVTVFHGVDVSAYLHHHPRIYRHLFARGDLFLPISEAWKHRLIEYGCDPARIVVHRMGVDTYRFRSQAKDRDRSPPHRILTIGRMIEKKGIDDGLRAVAELRNRGIAAIYTVVGDGPERGRLEVLASQLGLDGAVSFLGWRDQNAVAAIMADSDVLLAPSVTDGHGDQEGIPVTLMEAMASGLPVVATRHSGIPELIEDGVSGLLVPERSVPRLTDALQRLLADPDLAVRLAHAARERILAEFDIYALNQRLVGHYRRLLDRMEPPPSRYFMPVRARRRQHSAV